MKSLRPWFLTLLSAQLLWPGFIFNAYSLDRRHSTSTIMRLDQAALKTLLTNQLISSNLLYHSSSGRHHEKLTTPFNSKMFVPSLGNTYFSFTTHLVKNWPAYLQKPDGAFIPDPTRAVFLQGRAHLGTRAPSSQPRRQRWRSVPLAGSLIELPSGKIELTLTFHAHTTRTTKFFAITTWVNPQGQVRTSAKLQSAPLYALSSKIFAEPLPPSRQVNYHLFPESGRRLAAQYNSAGTYHIIDLATDCDHECTTKLGGTAVANARIAGFINSMETIYSLDAIYGPQLGLKFAIIEQIARTTYTAYPADLTRIEQLLYRFQEVQTKCNSRQADLCHLVTGKDTWYLNNGQRDYGVIGLGFLGTICQHHTPSESLALSEYLNDTLTPVIMAHEIGHNLGAGHDELGGGIMGPVLNPNNPSTTFSTKSRNEILAALQAIGYSCLALSGGSSSSSSVSSQSSPASSSAGSGGGGGGAGNPGPDDPVALLSLAYRGRSFTALTTLPENFGGGCQVELLGAGTLSAIEQKPMLLGSTIIADGLTQGYFVASNLKRVNPGKAGKAVNAYLRTRSTCQTGGMLLSVVKRLKISSPVWKKGLLHSRRAWFQAVSQKLQPAS